MQREVRVENKTNAFEKPGRLPGIKHPSVAEGSVKHNSSVSGSQDESESEPHQPLPPIKPAQHVHNRREETKKPNKGGAHEKYSTLKNEYSQQSLGNRALKTKKKFNEDIIRIDKAKIFKKTFLDGPKNGKKKKFANA